VQRRADPGMILFFDQYPYIGGGQRILLDIAEAVRGQSCAFCIPPGGPLEAEIKRRFPDARILDATPPDMTHRRKGVTDMVRLIGYTILGIVRHRVAARRATLLYANGGRQFPLVLALSLLSGTRAIYHLHLDHSRMEKKIITFASRFRVTYRIVAISEFVRARIATVLPPAGVRKLALVENALSIQFSSRPFRERFFGIPLRQMAIAGTIRPEKGQDQAIEIARDHPDLHLHILGTVGLGAEKWAADLRRSAPINVTFHGAVADVGEAFDRLGIQVSLVPSQWQEPFGLIAIESMALSCITVVQNSGALPDIAARTSAILCRDTQSMTREIGRLKGMTDVELSSIAKKQFSATQDCYAPKRFMTEIYSVMKGPV